MLVIQHFTLEDQGIYTCQKSNELNSLNSVQVNLIARPRLLLDFTPLPPIDSSKSSTPVVQGPPVSVELEIGHASNITCRINPKLESNVYLTWFFQGRQLIAPAFAIKQPIIELKNFTALDNFDKFEINPSYSEQFQRPVALDPAELDINIYDNGQVSFCFYYY